MKDFSALIGQMTVPEKLAQMTQLMGNCFVTEGFGKLMGISYGFDIPEELAWNIGSVLAMSGARKLREVQKSYLEHNRNKIPLLFMHDVIHGFRTIFPVPLAMACSFDPKLAEQAASIAAKEAAVSGLHVTFSPMADLVRDCRWGRVIESSGEDPLLDCMMTQAAVRGYQGDDVGQPYRLAACLKHFAGYGAAEGGRDYNTTEISTYQLENFYLPAYRAAVDAGCKLVMSAFNALNGVPCTANRALFRDLLREKWGFKGTVITDCTALYELVPHGYAADEADAAQRALEAGMDIEMASTAFYKKLPALIAEGKVSESLLDEAVLRILELKDELGLFENPYKDADEEMEKKILLCSEHRAAAREIAARSMVLLKNENHVLPLQKGKKIALCGPYADSRMLLDIWKCEGQEKECVSLADGLRGRADVCVAGGCEWKEEKEQPTPVDQTVAMAADCDVIVLALGEHPSMSAEAGSRAYITLPADQLALADRLLALGKKTVLVLYSGRPLELGSLADRVDAIWEAWFPGTEGGNALADLLLGEKEPTARLAMSFPHTVGQLPLYYNALPTGRPDVGQERYASKYIDSPHDAKYPFGFGLSYTTFEYSPVTLSAESMTECETILASVSVRNTGTRCGEELVQLYLRDLAGSYARPVKMLKAFQRVLLQPGETRTVSFTICIDMLKYYTKDNGYAAEAGDFLAFVGPDSSVRDGVRFTLK